MSQFPLCPVPYQMRMSGEMGMKMMEDQSLHAYQFFDNKENVSPSSASKKIMFPSTRAVLWNRNPTGNSTELCIPGNSSAVRLVLGRRTLQLAYKQLLVKGSDFNGFFIGQLHVQGDKITIIIDRFDPGRDGQIKSENGVHNIRIPTSCIPGDLNVPILLHSGMAFVDHVTTQTHTEKEFVKTMKLLECWCSRKDALNVSNLFSSKMKCCFQDNDDEILAYITCSLVSVKEVFSLVEINSIPIIPTALARNLEGPITLSDIQSQVKTGFITMDQTRKLLLLLETDPKAYSLPLVGVWISGVESVYSAEVWACCIRFIHNRNIEERVYAPPDSYLLLAYLTKSALPVFHEFSRKDNRTDDVQFQFLSCCEGIAMGKTSNIPFNDKEYIFELASVTTGALGNTFEKARDTRDNGYPDQQSEMKASGLRSSSISLDDSFPLLCPTLSPHPQMQMQVHHSFPSVPDLSMCEPLVVEANNLKDVSMEMNKENVVTAAANVCVESKIINGGNFFEPTVTKPEQVNKKVMNKLPRQTKASLARININKQVKNISTNKKTQKKTNLAIIFRNADKKPIQVEKTVSESILPVDERNEMDIDFERIDLADKMELDEPILKLPVKIRHSNSNSANSSYNSLNNSANSSYVIEKSDIKEPTNIVNCVKEQPYCPDYYSDASGEESFIFNSNREDIFGSAEYKTLNNDKFVFENSVVTDNNIAKSMDRDIIAVSENRSTLPRQYLKNTTKRNGSLESSLNSSEDRYDDQSDENGSNKEKDAGERTRSELYDLVLAQQEQLANLQSQLQLFMEHQDIRETLDKSNGDKKDDGDKEEEKSKKEEVNNREVASVQEKQQKQLNALELQVQEFLHHFNTGSPDKKDSYSQCSTADTTPATPLSFSSIAVNTGDSLLWPTVNMASTHSDTTPRGLMQAEGMESKSKSEGTKETFCQHCHRARKSYKNHRKAEENFVSNISSDSSHRHSLSLSEIREEDITSSIFEDTANSSQSIASSLREVDMPVYSDSQCGYSSPGNQRSKMDWDSSPMLGESASMLVEQEKKSRNEKNTDNTPQENSEREELKNFINPINMNNEEFYSQVMSQVQKLIEAQHIVPPSLNSSKGSMRLADDVHPTKDIVAVVTPRDDLQCVRNVTVTQLDDIVNRNKESESSSNRPNERQRSHSTGYIQTLPRINYTSMAVDETFNEESNFNKIAAKYLPDEYLQQEMAEVHNKIVKFEGVYELNSPLRNPNMASVNFSCNMSIASQKYLQRYELVDGEPVQPLTELNGRVLREHREKRDSRSHSQNQSIDSRSCSESDKENILDCKKLRSLPKLL